MAILYPELSYAIVGAAMEVHGQLGSGFLEQVYENALAHELTLRNISFLRQVQLPVHYKGALMGNYVADMIVENTIVLELKAVAKITSSHQLQARNYLAATRLKLAIVINFGEDSLTYKRVVA